MSKTVIRRVEPRSPAAKAGVQAGETLVEINGKQILDAVSYTHLDVYKRQALTMANSQGR